MVCLSLENLFLFWKSLQHQIVCCRLRQELTKWVKIHKMLQIKAGKPEAKQGEETILVYTGYIKAFSIRTHYYELGPGTGDGKWGQIRLIILFFIWTRSRRHGKLELDPQTVTWKQKLSRLLGFTEQGKFTSAYLGTPNMRVIFSTRRQQI